MNKIEWTEKTISANNGTVKKNDREPLKPYEELKYENEKLKKFARYCIRNICWDLNPDGGDIQDVAEDLGLIEPHRVAKEDTEFTDDYDVGDEIFVFTNILKGGEE